MHSAKNNVMKYLGTAMALGGAVMLGSGLACDNRKITKKMKKTADKAIDTFDGIVSNMHNMIK